MKKKYIYIVCKTNDIVCFKTLKIIPIVELI